MKRLTAFLKTISLECYAVCLYLLCLPLTVVTTPFGSLLKLITIPVVAVLGLKLFIGERKPLALNSIHLVYSVYLAYVLIGLLLSREELTIVFTKDMFLTYAVLILVTMRIYTENERQMIENTWILVGLFCIFLAFTTKQRINEYENRIAITVFGFAEDPNQFCAYFVMPMIVAFKRIVEKRKTFPLYIMFIILIFYSVLRTGSRGGMLALLVGAFMCMMLAVRGFKGRLGMLAAMLVCAVIVIFVIFPLLPADVQQRYSLSSVLEDSGAGRFDIWKILINYNFESPSRMIYGSGLLSTYGILDSIGTATDSGAAHNQFVQVFVDQGLIGLILFVLLIICCFFRNVRKQPYYSCAFLAIMAFSMSLTMYVFKPYINILMMCAMTFVTNEVTKKSIEPEMGERALSKQS